MERLRHLPAIHYLKEDERFLNELKTSHLSESVLTNLLKNEVDDVRQQLIDKKIKDNVINESELTVIIFEQFIKKVNDLKEDNLQSVINATGVVLHTNLGRAPLSERAIEQLTGVAKRYSTLEYNINTGKRGSRHQIVEEYITELTGAEAAIVVNNNAAAVYLVLKALAKGKEAIVSRGELVEIGGSFRISNIMEESDVSIVEVGTTNKTNVTDYEEKITEETALLLKVHKSNFKIIGFTEDVETERLVPLSKKYNIPIYEDLGSGTLFDFTAEGIGNEPTVQEKVQNGIDLISFSGDKLLGGPQAGIIVGKKKYINQLKTHQLARVLRVDKFILAALESTLKSYMYGSEQEDVPVIRHLTMPLTKINEKAEQFIEEMTKEKTSFTLEINEDVSKVGGGTMPEVELETVVVQIKHNYYSSEQIATRLRHYKIPIIVRVKDEAVIIDFRTVSNVEIKIITEALLFIEQD